MTSFWSFFLECSNHRRRPLGRRKQQDRIPQRLLRQSHYAVQISFLHSSQSKLQSSKSKTSPFCLPGQITVMPLVESQLTLLFGRSQFRLWIAWQTVTCKVFSPLQRLPMEDFWISTAKKPLRSKQHERAGASAEESAKWVKMVTWKVSETACSCK